jgi:spore coat polysaccharide biosynthesis protein SpsF
MSSQRLPGKVLMTLGGTPMIHEIHSRAMLCEYVGQVIVATSSESSDDELAEYCHENHLNIYRGSLNNVLSRFTDILADTSYEYVVRITGDCPLIHPPFIDAQIEALIENNGDIVYFSTESAILQGQGVLSSRALLHVAENTKDPIDLEHVGSKYFIDNLDEFRYVQFNIPEYFAKQSYRLTVDEIEDYQFLDKLFSMRWRHSSPGLIEVISWLNGQDNLNMINKDIEESHINQEIANKKNIFIPRVVGTFDWIA